MNSIFFGMPFVIAFGAALLVPFGVVLGANATIKIAPTLRAALLFWGLAIGSVLPIVMTKRSLNLEAELLRLTMDDVSSGFWASRVVTLFVLGFSAGEIVRMWGRHGVREAKERALLISALAFLFGLALVGATGATEPTFSYKVLYVPIVLVALYCIEGVVPHLLAQHLKWMLTIVMLGSLTYALIYPDQALLRPYHFLPGIDFRLYGVTQHANSLGPVALLLICVEFYFPSRAWFHRGILLVAFVVFVLAQSKTAWIAGIGILALVGGPIYAFGPKDPKMRFRNASILLIFCLVIVSGIVVLAVGTSFWEGQTILDRSGVTTFTGRDLIWTKTMEEFYANPVFGYGPDLWGIAYRIKTGLMYVGQAHNQFIHTLGKSGLIGFGLLISYLVVMTYVAMVKFWQTKGFVLAMVLIVLSRCLTEAPLENGVLLEWSFFMHAVL